MRVKTRVEVQKVETEEMQFWPPKIILTIFPVEDKRQPEGYDSVQVLAEMLQSQELREVDIEITALSRGGSSG